MIKGATMIHTHQTAPTQFVEANGIRFAYRRFGKTGGVPIVFNQHYIGTMDYWDPTVTDGLAHDREVILFNNAGVSSSSGEVPTTFEQMGANAIAFIKALGPKQVDLFGFSIGGMVVQEITLQAPDLVRRLIVDGAGPRGGQASHIEAEVTYGVREVRLRIRDDGKGIDPQHLNAGRARHWGLTNMRERAQQIGSELNLWSEVGAGTEVDLRIPGSVAYGPSRRRSFFRRIRKQGSD